MWFIISVAAIGLELGRIQLIWIRSWQKIIPSHPVVLLGNPTANADELIFSREHNID
jgi:hypothetical protein